MLALDCRGAVARHTDCRVARFDSAAEHRERAAADFNQAVGGFDAARNGVRRFGGVCNLAVFNREFAARHFEQRGVHGRDGVAVQVEFDIAAGEADSSCGRAANLRGCCDVRD